VRLKSGSVNSALNIAAWIADVWVKPVKLQLQKLITKIIINSVGPTIICDKSSLQALSKDELSVLRKYYSLNVPPILLVEILGEPP
jgi:hypothetical protein